MSSEDYSSTDAPLHSPGPHLRNQPSSHLYYSSRLKDNITDKANKIKRPLRRLYGRLRPLQRVLVVVAIIFAIVLGVLFLLYNQRFFGWLRPVVQKWRNLTGGWLILWSLIFIVSFPPLIGYSSLLTITGFVYGLPTGWFIAASATVVGSIVSFLLSRTILKNVVNRLVANDTRFTAIAQTLQHDGIKLLIMIRLCPLPYSLSNGAMATFPSIHSVSFAIATAAATPKLLIHIFVGAKLSQISGDEKMDTNTKIISYLSIVIGLIAGVATSYFMYVKTKARARKLELSQVPLSPLESERREYFDDPVVFAAPDAREVDDSASRDTNEFEHYADDIIDDEDPNKIFRNGDGDQSCDSAGR